MLTFEKHPDFYRVVQKIMGFTRTDIMTVDYKFDLSEKRVNAEPWSKTSQADIDWFNKYHKDKFPA